MRGLFISLIVITSTLIFASSSQEGISGEGGVTRLTMGSWRTDDVSQMEAILGEFSKRHPSIEVSFLPIISTEYNGTLRLQLESGTAPDIIYARSYSTGESLFRDGYLMDVSMLKGYRSNYTPENRAHWETEEGVPFAIPFAAVSHGIYYNKDLFNNLRLDKPETWSEFIDLCRVIKANGYIPIANGLADEWDIAEVVFMSIAPNYIGGLDGRVAYERGEQEFNDSNVVDLFRAMASLEPYLPQGYQAIGYNDSNALFATGQAAMFFDGSWSIDSFKNVDFEWGVFPPPKRSKEARGYITFHADAGIGINSRTKHLEEAKLLLEWFGSKDGAQVLGRYLPTGFFPMSKNSVVINEEHANDFLKLNIGRGTDVRWPWPRLLAGEPSGYSLMQRGAIGVITGAITPEEAANNLKNRLSEWYSPAQ